MAYRKHITTAIFFLIMGTSSLICQETSLDTVQFIDYYTIMDELNRKGKDSEFYTSLDYESMLYLNRASFETLKKLDPDFLKKNYIDTSSIFITVARQYVSEFPAKCKSINEFLKTKSNWIATVKALNANFGDAAEISKIVYVKDNTAICTFRTQTCSGKYRIAQQNAVMRFELLYQLIE